MPKTDFYRLMKSKEDRLGFPPGYAQKMLLNIFQQYDNLTRQDDKLRELRREEAEESKQAEVGEVPVEKRIKTVPDQPSKTKGGDPSKSVIQGSASRISEKEQDVKETGGDNKTDSDSQKSEDKTCEQSSGDKTESKKQETERSSDSEISRQQQQFQENPESYNGAVRENYSWSQSITDLDVRVKVPEYIRKGRDVKVDIGKKHLKVMYKDNTGQWIVVVNGDLTWEVQKDECMWTLNPGENVHINFEKKDERWWESVLTDEPKINVRKIDASRPMTDLDDEAQAKIEEMMYNDRMKKMGKPTSQEQKMQDMLKNAWDAEGSPFKGQPFDPSKFSMDSSGVMQMKPS